MFKDLKGGYGINFCHGYPHIQVQILAGGIHYSIPALLHQFAQFIPNAQIQYGCRGRQHILQKCQGMFEPLFRCYLVFHIDKNDCRPD